MARKTPKYDEILTPVQLQAIEGLMLGEKLANLSKQLNIPYDTLWRWKNRNEIFKGELNRRKRELGEASQNRLLSASQMAVNTLVAGLKDPDPNIRVRCAQSILTRLPTIELPPVTDWQAEMRERAELLAQGEENAKNNPQLINLIENLGILDTSKADRHYDQLLEASITDLQL